jgi:prevent-host-death family protein
MEFTVATLRNNLSEALARAAYGHEVVRITKSGKPYVAIVSEEDAQFLERHRRPPATSLETSVTDVEEFSPRTTNALMNRGLQHLGDVVNLSERTILDIPNMGRTSLNEIKKVLLKLGVSLPRF